VLCEVMEVKMVDCGYSFTYSSTVERRTTSRQSNVGCVCSLPDPDAFARSSGPVRGYCPKVGNLSNESVLLVFYPSLMLLPELVKEMM